MDVVCYTGNCEGCHLRSVCNQPCPYVDGHLDELIEATNLKIKCCIKELSDYMKQNGYKNLGELRGNVLNTWLKDVF